MALYMFLLPTQYVYHFYLYYHCNTLIVIYLFVMKISDIEETSSFILTGSIGTLSNIWYLPDSCCQTTAIDSWHCALPWRRIQITLQLFARKCWPDVTSCYWPCGLPLRWCLVHCRPRRRVYRWRWLRRIVASSWASSSWPLHLLPALDIKPVADCTTQITWRCVVFTGAAEMSIFCD